MRASLRHALAALLAASSTCWALAASVPLDQIAVIVNDGVILNSEIDARMADLAFQAKQRKETPTPQQLRQQAREQLILEALQLQLANRNSVRADDAAVEATLNRMARENGMTLAQFREQLDKTPGTSFAYVRGAVEREQIIERLRQRRMGERIKINDADIAQFMATPAGTELNRQLDEQLKPSGKKPDAPAPENAVVSQLLVTQILIPIEDDTPLNVQVQLSALAGQLLEAQRRGLSPEESVDSLKGKATEAAIESLGWRSLAQMPELLVEPIKRRLAGGTPELVRTPRGWHLLWISDRREVRSADASLPPPPPLPTTVVTQRQVRHILMRPNELQSSEDIHEAMKALHRQLKSGADFDQLARLKSQDPGSAVKGGDLGWVSPGDMVPEFDRMIGKTPIGSLSEPFQSPFGWHILLVEGERKQDMRESILKDRARQILFARAYDEELNAWLRELRAEAYVDFRGQR